MAEEQMMAMLQQIAEKVDAQGAKLDAVAQEQTAMRSEMNNRFERVIHRLDHLTTLATRAAARADDSLSAQSRAKTELAAIREHIENGDRKLVREVNEDIANLRERVEALEQKQ
jgi:hypothetical protein